MTTFNRSDSRSGFTRRDFLRGSGAAAAATALHTDADARQADQAGPKVISGATPITLNVNGENRESDSLRECAIIRPTVRRCCCGHCGCASGAS